MDIQEVILQEVRRVGERLDEHIQTAADRQTAIYKEIHDIHTESQLNKQRGNAIVAAISAVVSAAVAWLIAHFGGQS